MYKKNNVPLRTVQKNIRSKVITQASSQAEVVWGISPRNYNRDGLHIPTKKMYRGILHPQEARRLSGQVVVGPLSHSRVSWGSGPGVIARPKE